MNLQEYLRAIRAHWVLALSIFLLALATAGVITWQTTPLYAASTRLFVSTPGSDDSAAAYQGNLFSQQRVTSYAELIEGDRLASRVVDALDIDITPDSLSSAITASVVPETVILQATITDPSPERAQLIADAVGVEFAAFVTELERLRARTSPRSL
ncbi:MAG: hypothetical protein H0T40_10005 [Geodermatophilaceae bacterium]|nr:hypothetical protein [Geodermatophilaceae bacterium]